MSNKALNTLIDWSLQSHRDKLYEYLKTLSDRSYWVEIKLFRQNRSREANSYYWVGLVSPICEFHGYDPKIQEHRDKMHEKLKKQFNSVVVEFKRPAFAFKMGDGFENYNEVVDYLDSIDWKPDVMDGKILLPLRVVRNIPERFEYGEEMIVTDYETLPNTTTKMDTVEHYEYIERIRDFYALEYNFYIAPPENKGRALSEFD